MIVTEPFPGFTIREEKDGTFGVYQRADDGSHERIGSADGYEDAREIASAYSLLLQDAWA